MSDKTCKTCKHWEKSVVVADSFDKDARLCCIKRAVLVTSISPSGNTELSIKDGYIITGENGGCVHHEPKEDAR